MRTRSIVAFLSLLFSVSCSYSLTPVGIVSPQFVDRPREWEQLVQATEWGYFDDIAVGRTLHSMWAQAESMGADDILGIRMENNCYWSVFFFYGAHVRCWAGGTGLAVKYQSKK